jgi:beta-glucanase (GH16 family)
MPIHDAQGKKVSHRDDQFHIYTIEWRPDSIRFYIDGVQQAVIDDVVPDYPSRVIFGMRRMPWSGSPDWTGKQTMLIDWVDIEEL